ncbi:unnamed protein product [Zymoseptoria tritici ST99CH_1A5]|uniref:Uncharacterized protein n=2 Tax=Zymoseptoria tritici TaxID=1047171 RepID=A0A2H1G454_ZYMTR|nr:unnamed protein product [Zymoseptoria tritici ST99CH_1E4]SMY22115.1 unnamed protein product [Zymoseptoria tritici ST99CH_1A5]
MHFINFLTLPGAYGALQKLAPRQGGPPPPAKCVDTTQIKYTAELYKNNKCTEDKQLSHGTSYVGSCFEVHGIVGAKVYIPSGIPDGYACDTTLFKDTQCAEDGIISKPLDQTTVGECLTDPDSLTSIILPTKYNSIRVLCYQQLFIQ